ncbi:MAG: hypothetical protein RLY69_291 [Verrucomicrobiota bacterium]
MDVHLPHHVANARDIEFLGLKLLGHKLRYATDQAHHLSISRFIQLMQILHPLGHLGHDQISPSADAVEIP